MCSISGICNFEKRPSPQIVEIMTKSLSHRGPDDKGFFNNENISLGHNRLSIIDLKKSKQPMQDQQNRNVIIFNGEIYNFKELKEELSVTEVASRLNLARSYTSKLKSKLSEQAKHFLIAEGVVPNHLTQ